MMMCCMLGLVLGVHAQESVFLQQYREKVKAYNQDIKSAGYAVSIRQEAEKSAKADFLPSLSGMPMPVTRVTRWNSTGNFRP